MKSIYLVILLILCSCGYSKKKITVQKFKYGVLSEQFSAYTSLGDTIPDGNYRTYFPNGQLRWTTEYSDGIRHGIFKEFHDNGVLAVKWKWINGKRMDGTVFRYDRAGKISERIIIIGHKREGKRYLYRDGKIQSIQFWKNDFIDHVICTKDSLGNNLPLGSLKNGSGSVLKYHQNGRISEILVFYKGDLKWIALSMDENGKIRNGGTLINGKGLHYDYKQDGYVDTVMYK
jgi:antitoxin component YwqK of YwqJK toxin-antitoxin module